MPNRKKTVANDRLASAELVIGRERFVRISAVEGIVPTAAMKKRLADFEKRGLTAAERRKEIIKAHSKS